MTALLQSEHSPMSNSQSVATRAFFFKTLRFGDAQPQPCVAMPSGVPAVVVRAPQFDERLLAEPSDDSGAHPVAANPPRTSLIDAEWEAQPSQRPICPTVSADADTSSMHGVLDIIRRNRGRGLIGVVAVLSLTLLQTSNSAVVHLSPHPEFSTRMGNPAFVNTYLGAVAQGGPEREKAGELASTSEATPVRARAQGHSKARAPKLGRTPWRNGKTAAPATATSPSAHAPGATKSKQSHRIAGARQRYFDVIRDSERPL